MTAAALGFVLDHWREALIAVGVLAAFGYCHERDNRIRAEAQREVYVQRFTETLAQVDSLEAWRARADSQAVLDAKRFAEMRREADSLRALARAAADSASQRVTEAGDSLAATLDSLHRVAPPSHAPLVAKAKDQHHRERVAVRSMREAMREERRQLAGVLAAADSTSRMWARRYHRLERVHEAQGRALAEARAAVGAREPSGDSWGSRALLVAGGVVVGGLAVAVGM